MKTHISFKNTSDNRFKIPTATLAACFAVSTIICFGSLKSNNQTMITLRNQLYQADKDNKDVEGALRKLRQFVYGHMNTNLVDGANGIRPPIQLLYTYQRAVDAERARVSAINEKVSKDAQSSCEQRFGKGQVAARLKCVEEYQAVNGAKENAIPDSFYKFDFVSPSWSPDVAGFSLIATIILGAWLVIRLLVRTLNK